MFPRGIVVVVVVIVVNVCYVVLSCGLCVFLLMSLPACGVFELFCICLYCSASVSLVLMVVILVTLFSGILWLILSPFDYLVTCL